MHHQVGHVVSAACLWSRDGETVAVNVTRTEGADIPAGHYEAYVIPTGTTEFVPITELVPYHDATEIETLGGPS